jgi:hypothetical protein
MLNFSPVRCHPGLTPTGAKLALKPVHVWGIRVRLQVASKTRDLALGSKLRGCCQKRGITAEQRVKAPTLYSARQAVPPPSLFRHFPFPCLPIQLA